GSQTLSAALLRSQGEVEFSGGYSDAIEQAANVSLEGPLSDFWHQRLSIGNSREDLNTPAFFTQFLSRRDMLDWQNVLALGSDQHLTIGLDRSNENGETLDTFFGVPQYRASRNNTGIYAGLQAGVGAFDSEVALRRDHNNVFGDATTGSAAIGWRFSEFARAYLSYGQGFRAPTLNEQYSPGYSGFFAGNPDLDAEKSHSAELGFEFTPARGQRLKSNLYSTRVRNLINFSGPMARAENVADARIDGGELSYDGDLREWSLHADITWQNSRDESNDQALVRRPKIKFTSATDYRLSARTRIGLEFIYSGKRADVGAVTLPAYAIVNLRGSLALASDWLLRARIENVTDRDYELVHGYNTPARSGFIEVVWQPQP
ncbi:MAG: TonB-dependent receptor, partial [Dokdonella sp.]